VSARRVVPPLVAAVKRDLAALERRSPGAGKSAPAMLCLRLAEEIEAPPVDIEGVMTAQPLGARVSAGKLLAETLAALNATAPAEQKVDRLDELTARRASRKASA
jgi:hypothetical protein